MRPDRSKQVHCLQFCIFYTFCQLYMKRVTFLYLLKIDNGYCILTETSLYLNMFQFVLAILFAMKLSTISTNHAPCNDITIYSVSMSERAVIEGSRAGISNLFIEWATIAN